MGYGFSHYSTDEPFPYEEICPHECEDIWRLIIRNIKDHKPKNVVVYLLWLMQVNKLFERLVREYFEQNGVQPYSKIILRGAVRARFESSHVVSSKPYEIRYGVVTKKKIWAGGCGAMVYRFVRNGRIVSVKFMFDILDICQKVCYKNDDFEFEIELPARSSEDRLSKDHHSEVDVFRSKREQEVQREIQWCYGIAARWIKQAKIDLF